MADMDEWKRAYYEKKSRKRFFIILFIIIVALAAGYLFLKVGEGRPVDIGIELTEKDVTYSAEVISSEEIKDEFEAFSGYVNSFTDKVKSQTGYGWAELIKNPNDGKDCKVSAVLHILSENAVIGFEYGYLGKLVATSKLENGILSLPINTVDPGDTSKNNILLLISYLRVLAEFYNERGLNFAETDINRLEFLYHYFEAVDIDPETSFDIQVEVIDLDHNYTRSEKYTFGFIIKQAMTQYNAMYSMIMKIAEINEASGNKITIKNTGREDIYLTEKYQDVSILVDRISTVCMWSTDVIKPGETAECILEEPCTGKDVRMNYPSGAKDGICS